MPTEDQTKVIEFLSSPSTYGGAPVERIETHTAFVFLTGDRAFKLKRAVRYDYLDFSTLERRKKCCEAEVRINRRTAPALYRGVVPITRERNESLMFVGAGDPVDWVVEMKRFDQEGLFDRLAAHGRLGVDLMPPLARSIARFHQAAARRLDHGGRAGMAWVIDGNASGFVEQGTGVLDAAACTSLSMEARAAVDGHGGRLDRRRQSGFVRECHGDMHLRNIVLLEGQPTLFDAIEFNDEIACIDVLYDLAFLLMDLWRRDLPRHANATWNTYLAETADFDGIELLPLFLSCRAAVRAKTSATSARVQSDAGRRSELQEVARDYLRMAANLLHPPPASLIAIGGLSGSGKSTLALTLAPSIGAVPGALVIRSDELRKRLCGVPPLARLGPEGYTPEVSRRVYETAARCANLVVRAGHSAIVDAVFARETDRAAIGEAAAKASVPFVGLWLDAPEPVLLARSLDRQLDPSDADSNVIRMQLAQDTGPIAWHRIDAAAPANVVLRHATAFLNSRTVARPLLIPH